MPEIHRLSVGENRLSVVEWLRSRRFIENCGAFCIAWSCRSGYDRTSLEFHPLARHANDTGWAAVIGRHASGTNPRIQIGTCESMSEVMMVYDTIRRINGYPDVEDERILPPTGPVER
jgi:hypothetical protein